MKVLYNKLQEFKIFGFKLFEFNTQYLERSTEKDDSDNDFYIELKQREFNNKNNG
jgi:hypothetical protein